MKMAWLLCSLLFLLPTLHAQEQDSVFYQKDYEKISYISRLFRQQYAGADEKKVRNRFEALLAAAKGKDNAAVKIAALVFMGKYYIRENNLPKALTYYEEALALSRKQKLIYMEPVLLHLAGNLYYKQDQYAAGLEKLIRANIMMESIGFRYFPDIAEYLYDLGFAYAYYYEDFPAALQYVTSALKYPIPSAETEILSYNMLGLLYRSTGKPKESATYFHLALDKALLAKDTANIGEATGNIGFNYFQAGQLDSAETLILKDYQLSLLKQNWTSACLSQLVLAEIDLARNNIDDAQQHIQQTRVLLAPNRQALPKKALYTISYNLYRILAEICRLQKNTQAIVMAQDSLILYKDSLFFTKESHEQASVQIKLIKESNQYQLQLLKSEEKRNILLRNTLIVICLLVIIVAVQALYRLKLANRDNEEKLLEYANILAEKNQLIEQFRDEMQQLKNQPEHIEHEIETIFKALRSHTILTEEDWLHFKQLFERIYKNFFSNITQKIPDITQSEIRLLALTKLGLSTKEMADMQGVAPESIRKARYRLRKKIELKVNEEKDITLMLKSI
jgi:DNA-binding CsgD family transcriptional regulator